MPRRSPARLHGHLLATQDRNEAVTFMLSPLEPKLTQLRMKVMVNGQPLADRTMMTKIWQQLEREAMLESRPSDRLATTTQPATTQTAERSP